MFELVNGLRSELTGTPLKPTPPGTHERLEVVKDVVQRLYASVIPQDRASPNVVSNSGSFVPNITFCDCFKYTIFAAGPYHTADHPEIKKIGIEITPLMLIDSAEIPERFRIIDINDPRLNDNEFLQNYADWLHDKFSLPRRKYDIATFKMNFFFLQDRQKAKEALKFAMLHELGHLHNNDLNNMQIPNTLIHSIITLSLPICVAIALLLCFPLTPPFLALCATVAVATTFFTHYTLQALPLAPQRDMEYNADLFVAENCPSAIDGGIYFLNTVQKQLGSAPAYLQWAYDLCEPVLELFEDHPSPSKRLAVLEAMKNNRQPANHQSSVFEDMRV